MDPQISSDGKPRILAVLNCYDPTGANRAQVVLRADGSVTPMGETSLGCAALFALIKGAPKRKRGRPSLHAGPRAEEKEESDAGLAINGP